MEWRSRAAMVVPSLIFTYLPSNGATDFVYRHLQSCLLILRSGDDPRRKDPRPSGSFERSRLPKIAMPPSIPPTVHRRTAGAAAAEDDLCFDAPYRPKKESIASARAFDEAAVLTMIKSAAAGSSVLENSSCKRVSITSAST